MLAGSTRHATDSQPIDKNVAFAAFDSFVTIKASGSSTFRRLYRLTIHNDEGWTQSLTGLGWNARKTPF